MRRDLALGCSRVALLALLAVPAGYLLAAVNNVGAELGIGSFSNWLTHRPETAAGSAIYGAVIGFLWHMIRKLENSN
jgi:hypothetical protein